MFACAQTGAGCQDDPYQPGAAHNHGQVAIQFSTAKTDRLDPGQDSTDVVNVDFPAEALKQNELKDIQLQITYLPSAFKHETLNLAVSIGGQ